MDGRRLLMGLLIAVGAVLLIWLAYSAGYWIGAS